MEKNEINLTKILLSPILLVISIIKHFFIGIKFVFYDVFKSMFETHESNKIFEQNVKGKTTSNIPVYNPEIEDKVVKTYYKYTGVDGGNNKVSGTISATSKITLQNFLASEGIRVDSIKNATGTNILKKIGLSNDRPLSTKELIFWLTQVSTYLKAGLTINDTIRIMARQARKDKAKSVLYESIAYELTLGENFSTALKNQGGVFPSLLINMIESAEATGEIITTLDDMGKYYTEIDKTHKDMISAIIYPAILLVFSIAVLTFILVFVIPEFIKVYKQAGITVNGFTLTIINISNYLTSNLSIVILLALLIIITLLFLYKKSKFFRKIVQIIGMKTPFFGNIIIYHEITLFTKTFASLLKNSVYITNSMEILSNITNNEVYKDIIYETMNNIARGEKISLSFENKWCIPDVAYYMIITGESTGELGLMMEKVSNYYNDLHKSKVVNFKSFLEPIMIVILALIVGIVLLAVVIPMFSLYSQIR